ncbi:39S ribosomal protein L12, mitochondrial-like isoform X2 [Varroa destructor]|uniref:39S ribosomal protein L12, mitochondrial n=1 Tax=Varroa destructor TaxID=109461 RepID=A0A7M7J9B0_VARDE|nr:39S ribosomal protein L12, mitochondrial-like isoform X2 [Varroa destructor]
MFGCVMALRLSRFALQNGHKFRGYSRCMSAIAQPQPVESKQYPEKITNIVTEISKLTLIEVADLNELLKKTLNIQETPMMAAVAAGPAVPAAPAEDDEPQVKKMQTSFKLKLVKFDEAKKIALIKELKNIMEGTNLVQAKKFVESVPQVIKGDLTKEEAEGLKKTIEAVGGGCEIL